MKINLAIAKLVVKFIIFCCCLIFASCNRDINHSSLVSAQVTRIVSGQTITIDRAEPNNPSEITASPNEVALPGETPGTRVDRSEATSEFRRTKVRIIGIEAPDFKQSPWGKAAQQKLKELLPLSQTIQLELETDNLDHFDRLLAHVWHNEILVSEELLESGYVLANTKYPHKYSQRLADAQEYARLMGYGIWNPQQPMRQTPSQFRSQPTAR